MPNPLRRLESHVPSPRPVASNAGTSALPSATPSAGLPARSGSSLSEDGVGVVGVSSSLPRPANSAAELMASIRPADQSRPSTTATIAARPTTAELRASLQQLEAAGIRCSFEGSTLVTPRRVFFVMAGPGGGTTGTMDRVYQQRDPRDAVVYLDPGNTGADSLAGFRSEVRRVLQAIGPGTPLSMHLQSGAGHVAVPVVRELVERGRINGAQLDLIMEATPVLSPWTTHAPDSYAESAPALATQALREHVVQGTGQVFPNNLANRVLNQASRNIAFAQAATYFSGGFIERMGQAGIERIIGNLDMNPAGVLSLGGDYQRIDLRDDLRVLRQRGAHALFINGMFDHSVNPNQGLIGASAFANQTIDEAQSHDVVAAGSLMRVIPVGEQTTVVNVQAGHYACIEVGSTAIADAVRRLTEQRATVVGPGATR